MPIQPTDLLKSLTNAKCAELRDDLVALIAASGIADPTVRQLKRRVRKGIDAFEMEKDTSELNSLVESANVTRQAEHEAMKAILIRREARSAADYGED